MQKIYAGIAIILTASLFSCKDKPKQPEEQEQSFFPVNKLLADEVKKVEGGVYPITLNHRADSVTSEEFLKREEFRHYAQPFLDIPDIGSGSLKSKYKEDKFFDQDVQKVIIVYTATDEGLSLRREELHINPEQTADSVNKVERILLDTWESKGDSTVQQRLSWKMGQSFRVVKTVRMDTIEHTVVNEVKWNEPSQ